MHYIWNCYCSLGPDQAVEQYCLLVCNFPPSSHSCVESMKYGGKTHEQLSKIMVEVSSECFRFSVFSSYFVLIEEFESISNLTEKSAILQEHI